MRYKEFKTNVNGLERRLGILGEVHIYTPTETDFATQIVPTYDFLAVEGSGSNDLPFIRAAHKAAFLAYATATPRSRANSTAEKIAQLTGTQINHLEPDIKKLFTNKQRMALFGLGILGTLTSPLLYYAIKTSEDPHQETAIPQEKKTSLIHKLVGVGGLRDKVMAERSAELFKKGGDMLIVCGKAHMKGIEENLQQLYDLHHVGTHRVTATESAFPRPRLDLWRLGEKSSWRPKFE